MQGFAVDVSCENSSSIFSQVFFKFVLPFGILFQLFHFLFFGQISILKEDHMVLFKNNHFWLLFDEPNDTSSLISVDFGENPIFNGFKLPPNFCGLF